jgi:hypothetical protein
LEAGANGILYPRVETVAQAQECVRWAKFAPLGEHGFDGGNPDSPYGAMDMPSYIAKANEETFILAQIDTMPIPLWPALQKKGIYSHHGVPYPTSGVILLMLAASFGKNVFMTGIDLYSHPSGNSYAQGAPAIEPPWPSRHSLDTDMSCLRQVYEQLGSRLEGHCVAATRLGVHDPFGSS